MLPARFMTSSKARETIDRLSEQTGPLREQSVAPETLIEEFTYSRTAFVPRKTMSFLYTSEERYSGETAHPGAYVPGSGLLRLFARASSDFDALPLEQQQQTPDG
jgi:hypothetical protein